MALSIACYSETDTIGMKMTGRLKALNRNTHFAPPYIFHKQTRGELGLICGFRSVP
jgi:hypothetical protein